MLWPQLSLLPGEVRLPVPGEPRVLKGDLNLLKGDFLLLPFGTAV